MEWSIHSRQKLATPGFHSTWGQLMQLIADGPDIPNDLLDAHEDGRVVFFCGAGISYPAGLPGFKGLVEKLYTEVNTVFTDNERIAFDKNQYDATLDLLERRLPGGRLEVRKALATVLSTPPLLRKHARDTHEALLELAHTRDDSYRLVTTNFDRIFEKIIKQPKRHVPTCSAPMLPVPKNSRWNGLVYLHGLLPPDDDHEALNSLVVTSGDFGLAYLTERWAARFASELFRNYVVCFVGYSIEDPVLRYMMDAIAADRMLGEQPPQAYAFGDYEPGTEVDKKAEWEAKGVTPILYPVRDGADHSPLHRSLKEWSEIYRDGVSGKRRIVVDNARAKPSQSTTQDNFVGRMLWALCDQTGLPAKQFAELEPPPPLEWLEVFSDHSFRHKDLTRFGVIPDGADDGLQFSLFDRPAPYHKGGRMNVVSRGHPAADWDTVMTYLAEWLLRYLDDPRLLLWLAQSGGTLHDRMAWRIRCKMERYARLERSNRTQELEEIRSRFPNAIPRPLLRPLWRLMLANRLKTQTRSRGLHDWLEAVKADGLTFALRSEFRELLKPTLVLRKASRIYSILDPMGDTQHLKQLVDWDISFAAQHIRSGLYGIDSPRAGTWLSVAPELLEDVQLLLLDTLRLLHELGGADPNSDRSHWHLPSITHHWQNGHRPEEWTLLVECLRDAWSGLYKEDPQKARRVAIGWYALPYSTFKRLALFAASHDGAVTPRQWVSWLTGTNCRWLWASETTREVCRLLVLQGRVLTGAPLRRLEKAILDGPPRNLYSDNIEPNKRRQLVDYSVWLRLAKLHASGITLGDEASKRLSQLQVDYPGWTFETHESEEFPNWSTGTGRPDFEDARRVLPVPRDFTELVTWLEEHSEAPEPFIETDWPNACEQKPEMCARALKQLSTRHLWHAWQWKEALTSWTGESQVGSVWNIVVPLLFDMPDEHFNEMDQAVSWWLETLSKNTVSDEKRFIGLCQRILSLQYDAPSESDALFRAINHPVGHVTEAILNIWFARSPSDCDGVPSDIKPLLTQLTDTDFASLRYGRILLASRAIALFRIDPEWAETNLLPLFDWGTDTTEAAAAWKGFLWSPRLYYPLYRPLKPYLLDTASHCDDLGGSDEPFASLLTITALHCPDGFSYSEFRDAFKQLPQPVLEHAAHALAEVLNSSADDADEFWRNRVKPFWDEVWPKDSSLASKSIAEDLALAALATDTAFPDALETFAHWLKLTDHLHFILHKLGTSDLISRFPSEVLRMLDAIVDTTAPPPRELRERLKDIGDTDPKLKTTAGFRKLSQHVQKH